MAKENENVVFVKVDVDECQVCSVVYCFFAPFRCIQRNLQFQDVAEKYRVTAMPTLVVFKNGNELGRVVGANEASIRELIQANV